MRERDTNRPTSKWKKADDDDDIGSEQTLCLPFVLLTCGPMEQQPLSHTYHTSFYSLSLSHTHTPTLNPARVA